MDGGSLEKQKHLSSIAIILKQLNQIDINALMTILCLTSRTTVTSVRIRARNVCVFSHVQKATPGLTHKGCVLQRVSLGSLSDVTVVLGMRQSIVKS